jgi:hypothetical protein
LLGESASDQNPDGVGDIVIVEGHGHIARRGLELEVERKNRVQFLLGDASVKLASELLYVGAGGDVVEEILADDLLGDEAGKLGLSAVEGQNAPSAIKLDGPKREFVEFGGTQGNEAVEHFEATLGPENLFELTAALRR